MSNQIPADGEPFYVPPVSPDDDASEMGSDAMPPAAPGDDAGHAGTPPAKRRKTVNAATLRRKLVVVAILALCIVATQLVASTLAGNRALSHPARDAASSDYHDSNVRIGHYENPAGDACATTATDTDGGESTYLHSYCVPGANPQRTEAFNAGGDMIAFTADSGRRTVIQADYAYGAEDVDALDTIAFFAWILLVAVGGFIGLVILVLALAVYGAILLVRWVRRTTPGDKREAVKRLASTLETVVIVLMVPVLVVTGAHAAVAVAFQPYEWCSGTSSDGSYTFTATTRTVNALLHAEAPAEFTFTTFDDAGNPTDTTTVKTTIPPETTGCETDLTAGHAYITATTDRNNVGWTNSTRGTIEGKPHVLAVRWDL